MKTNRLKYSILTALAFAALALAPSVSLAASDINFGPTGSEASISNPDGTWIHMWGGVSTWAITFDAANPPPSGDTTGSVYNQGDWTGAAQDNFNTVANGNWWGAGAFNGADYTSIELDIKYDTNSTIMPISAAHLEIGLNQGYSKTTQTNVSFNTASQAIADGNWHHLSIPISASLSGINNSTGVGYYQWNASALGTMNFWTANVKLIARIVPVAPPTVSIPTKTTEGLNVFSSTAGLNDRQSAVLRQTSGLSWVGMATPVNPVTYSFTIAGYPTSVNCEAYLFLIPNPNYLDAAPDWNETNCALAYLQGNASSATMHFRYKVNEDHQQAMYSGGSETRTDSTTTNNFYYTAAPGTLPGGPITNVVSPGVYNITNESGNLGSVTNNGVLGTWTIKFTSDTNVTLIAPNGNTSTCSNIPPYNVGNFAEQASPGFYVYLGMQANNADALNQAVVYSHFAISNTANPFSENFLADSVLDTTNTWNTSAASGPAGVLIVPANSAYWVSWTLPDSGFNLEISPTLTGGALAWTSPSSFPVLSLASTRSQLVASNEIPVGSTAFFRLIKRVFTQLQVLLPGETNAPNTLTGKGGTPTAATSGDLVTVTVNAVDATWNKVNVSGDNIHLTTTDNGVNGAITPNDSALANGTMTGIVQFNDSGSWTTTATDTSNTNIISNTSSPLTVN